MEKCLTVKELIEELQKFPEEYLVKFANENCHYENVVLIMIEQDENGGEFVAMGEY